MQSVPVAPRPRFLTIGLSDEENAAVADFAGDVRVARDMSEVHPEEHDVLITVGVNYYTGNDLFEYQLLFAPLPDPDQGIATSGWGGSSPLTRVSTQNKPARGFLTTADAGELGLTSLVQRTCVPSVGSYTGLSEPLNPRRRTRAFLYENLSHPLMLAGLFETPSDS